MNSGYYNPAAPFSYTNAPSLMDQMSQWGYQPNNAYGMSQMGTNLMGMTPEQAAALNLGERSLQMTSDYQNKSLAMDQARLDAAKLTPFQQGVQTFGTAMQGVGSLYGIYAGLQNMKQQKAMFNFQKGVANTNINNSISDYNRRLGDTLANRSLNNGQGQSWVDSQLSKYSAKRYD